MTLKVFEKDRNISFHGMNGRNPLFSKEENLQAKEITEQFLQSQFLTSNTNPKLFQNLLDSFYKSNSFFCNKLSEYKIEDAAFFFKSPKSYENYKSDKKLLSQITKKDILFLNRFKESIDSIPNLFEYKSDFDPENRLNLLTFAVYKKNYRDLLEKNDELAKEGKANIPLSIENITLNMSDYHKASTLGNILSSQNSFYNSEKFIFDRDFSKYYCSQLLEEIKDLEINRDYGINDFLKTFKSYTKENPELSEDSVSVMKHLFKGLTKTQKNNVTRDFENMSLNEKKLKSFLDKSNLSIRKDAEYEVER